MNEFNSHKEHLMKLAAKRYPLKGVSCASERNKRIGLRAAFIRRMMEVAFPEKTNEKPRLFNFEYIVPAALCSTENRITKLQK